MSHIAHTGLDFAGPYDKAMLAGLFEQVSPAPATVLDVGCGQGGMLAWVLERYPDATGVGIDLSLGDAATVTAAVGNRIELIETDAATMGLPAADLVVCVGSTHVFGGLDPTLARLRTATRRHLVIGEGFWQQPPTPAALEALGGDESEFRSLEETLAPAEDMGLRMVAHVESSQEQWDHYETAWCGNLERFAAAHPHDPDSDALAETARRHREGYINGYRGILGFTLLLLEVPD